MQTWTLLSPDPDMGIRGVKAATPSSSFIGGGSGIWASVGLQNKAGGNPASAATERSIKKHPVNDPRLFFQKAT